MLEEGLVASNVEEEPKLKRDGEDNSWVMCSYSLPLFHTLRVPSA